MRVHETPAGLVIEVTSEAETDRLGAAVAAAVVPGTVIGLIGPLGAGKTRLARAIATALGVDPLAVSSPTFVLIHEYEGHLPVYHFDAYRLDGPEPFEALGVAEYWDAGGVCLVEWADRVASVLPESSWTVRIELTGHDSRRVSLSGPDERARAAIAREIAAEV
jgi:tRNA threonylcarbamoyladenosine biosynthesis protein TsaE